MRVTFVDEGWDDYRYWCETDRHTLARINKLIEAARRDPTTGLGKPEPLRHALRGAWSRRIDQEHRLVYVVVDDDLVILQCRYHYTK